MVYLWSFRRILRFLDFRERLRAILVGIRERDVRWQLTWDLWEYVGNITGIKMGILTRNFVGSPQQVSVLSVEKDDECCCWVLQDALSKKSESDHTKMTQMSKGSRRTHPPACFIHVALRSFVRRISWQKGSLTVAWGGIEPRKHEEDQQWVHVVHVLTPEAEQTQKLTNLCFWFYVSDSCGKIYGMLIGYTGQLT